ncbi:uncharacterized protein [Coffea arabica]|uniref:Uncharacterized protein isoform X1 n=1 Tax=Coffea arabica TaxID=13443 RepID=A0ABM4VJ00_COFAR
MATSLKTISAGLRASGRRAPCWAPPPLSLTPAAANERAIAIPQGLAWKVVEGDVAYITKMDPEVLKRTDSICSLESSKAIGSNLNELRSNSAPVLLSMKFLRSFSTARDDDSCQPQHLNASNASTSQPNNNYNHIPEPIPNRPLRGERRPTYPSARQQNEQQSPFRFSNNENLQREKRSLEDSDFLEKFRLGFDRKKGENPNHKQSPDYNERGGDKSEQAAAESPAQSQPPEDADEIFRKMKETGLIPNAVAMLDGLCKDGLVQEAMKLFGLMREKGTIPEVVIYTAVVEGFCKAQKLDDAVRIFRKMQNNGITPNAFSYGVLIQGLYRGKRLDDARDFCLEMLENGHSPNLATFAGLVDGFCREKGLEEAQTMISTLRQKGFFLDEKATREYLEKKGPFLPLVWEAILGRKPPQRSSFFS